MVCCYVKFYKLSKMVGRRHPVWVPDCLTECLVGDPPSLGSGDAVDFEYLSLDSCSFEMGYVVALPVTNTGEVFFALVNMTGCLTRLGFHPWDPSSGCK